jgi:hypothetical protein
LIWQEEKVAHQPEPAGGEPIESQPGHEDYEDPESVLGPDNPDWPWVKN